MDETMNPDVLRALADRCEREEPGDELNLAIAKACGWTFGGGRPSGGTWRDPGGKSHGWFGAPPFTTSLDAAATLVPEGYRWGVEHKNEDLARASAWVGEDIDAMSEKECLSPAAALCAASLRARAALADGDA